MFSRHEKIVNAEVKERKKAIVVDPYKILYTTVIQTQ